MMYSFGTAKRGDKKYEQIPGVGNYDPERPTNRKPPQWKIGTAQRLPWQMSQAPGPGQYEEVESAIKRRFPEYSFGLKCFAETGKGFTPGPGAYDPVESQLAKSASAYSMRQRLVVGGPDEYLRETKNGPGPAAYETNYSTVLTRPSSRIGNQGRGGFYDAKKWIPGVGSYNTRPGTAGPHHKFPNSLRDSQYGNDRVATPGPGAYMHKSQLTNKSAIMSSKRIVTNQDQTPGPAQYEPSTTLTKRQQSSTRVGTAQQRLNGNRAQTPGPGAYELNNSTKRRPPSYKMGLEQRKLAGKMDIPGPGQYDISREMGLGKSYTLRPKYQDKQKDETPGPLDYLPLTGFTKNRPTSCRIGTELRSTTRPNDQNPAPNYYQIYNEQGGPKYPFGSELRDHEKESAVPGPGQYNLPPYVGNVPQYLIPK